ncbi:hypothetical protein CPB86DRAFT_291763 [Serendipita vermifera]|nr:hypothetical protein CPB86DRAFT_291763 [Serendipita vermifera]
MLVITRTLTIGQITFILRVALQVLTLGGPFLIGLLILANASRIASFSTHDVLNRIMGHLSVTRSSIVWIWHRIRRTNQDPARSSRLTITITLLVLYGIFASLSDIGLLGIYTCSTSGSNKYDYPGSLSSPELVQSAIINNLVNGTDPKDVIAYRCDSSLRTYDEQNNTIWACRSWHNSTWADDQFFSGVNTTDSEMLMPRQLGVDRSANITINSFYASVVSTKIENPTISRGILINPTDMGFQAVFGVPSLDPGYSFTLNRVMALEVEMGCMTLGIATRTAAVDSCVDEYATNGTWKLYHGPEYLYDALSNTTDAIREQWLPIFNTSTLNSDGIMTSYGLHFLQKFIDVPTVQKVLVPRRSADGYYQADTVVTDWMVNNCTNQVRQNLGLPPPDLQDVENYPMCGIIGLNSVLSDGSLYQRQSKMICATSTQVNMVSITARKGMQQSISVDINRLPSHLNSIRADFWLSYQAGNVTRQVRGEPWERYTLSDGVNGLTSHFISQYGSTTVTSSRMWGPGSGGYALSRVGSTILDTTLDAYRNGWLAVLNPESNKDPLHPSRVTQWAGQVGASYINASLEYNSWTALGATPILLTSHDGNPAICYHPIYSLAFLPLVLMAVIILIWSILTLLGMSFRHVRHLGDLYGGIYPYWKARHPNPESEDTVLIWEKEPQPHLDLVAHGRPLSMEVSIQPAVEYLTPTLQSEGERTRGNNFT